MGARLKRRKRRVTSVEANASKAKLLAELDRVERLMRQGRTREAWELVRRIAEDDSYWLWGEYEEPEGGG